MIWVIDSKEYYPAWPYSVPSGRSIMDQIDAMLNRDWKAANSRGQQTLARPLAASADYDAPAGEIVIHLNNGDALRIQTDLLQGLESASPVQLADIHLGGRGTGLHFPRLDADFYIPALVGWDLWHPCMDAWLKAKSCFAKGISECSSAQNACGSS